MASGMDHGQDCGRNPIFYLNGKIILDFLKIYAIILWHGGLAQLVRAPASHAGGHWFESSSLHHVKSLFCLPDKRGFLQWYPFLSERVIYLRYDIALRAMIYAFGIWRNGYYIIFATQIYHTALPYIISRKRYIIEKHNKLWYNQLDKLEYVEQLNK